MRSQAATLAFVLLQLAVSFEYFVELKLASSIVSTLPVERLQTVIVGALQLAVSFEYYVESNLSSSIVSTLPVERLQTDTLAGSELHDSVGRAPLIKYSL